MTTLTKNDLDGMPVVYSAIFTAVKGQGNPKLEPDHPWADEHPLRVRIPKGVATVHVSTNFVGPYRVCHQEVINGTPINNWYNMDGSGVFYARAVAEGSTIFFSVPNMPNSTDNWGIVVTSFPSGAV